MIFSNLKFSAVTTICIITTSKHSHKKLTFLETMIKTSPDVKFFPNTFFAASFPTEYRDLRVIDYKFLYLVNKRNIRTQKYFVFRVVSA